MNVVIGGDESIVMTDYDSIAARFDEDRRHWDIPVEGGLEEIVRRSNSPVLVLDLGCGTGNWLATQSSRIESPLVQWVGFDPSTSMLAVARNKVPAARLAVARAEAIPVTSASCAYVSINFAFHHFADKERALDEIQRVIASEGFLSINTPQPQEMRHQWVFEFFEGTWEMDQKRFWPGERLRAALERRGFDVKEEWERFTNTRTFSEILRRAELRVISELADLDDDLYLKGLERVRRLAKDPEAVFENESAMLRIEAKRKA